MINMAIVLLKAFFTLERLRNVECGGKMITNVDLSVLKQVVVAHIKVLASFCFGSANSEFPITSFWIYIFTLMWVFVVYTTYNNNKNNFCNLNSSLDWVNFSFIMHTAEHIVQNFTNVKFKNTNVLKRWQTIYV